MCRPVLSSGSSLGRSSDISTAGLGFDCRPLTFSVSLKNAVNRKTSNCIIVLQIDDFNYFIQDSDRIAKVTTKQ